MRILTIRKKKILMALLSVCLVWLVYFSFCLTGESQGSRETGESGDAGKEAKEVSQIEVPSLEYLPDEIGMEEYFVNYRIEREKVRSEQLEILNEIVNNSQSGSSVREKAQEKLLSLTQTLENELKLENLIMAKQYQDAAVFIQPESVMVVVKCNSFNETDTVKIADLVSNTTGHPYEEIIITTKN